MLNPELWLSISKWVTLISIILALGGGIGTFYFGNKVEEIKNKKIFELEEKIKVWSLNDDQILEITEKLKTHQGISVKIIMESDPTLTPFVENLISLFSKSNWKVTNSTALGSYYNGIIFSIPKLPDNKVPDFITDLYFELQKVGIEVKEIVPKLPPEKKEFQILIGKKKK